MEPFSIFCNEGEFREAIDDSMAAESCIGELAIEHMEDGRTILVSPQATQNVVGLYIPCHHVSDAMELANSGVTVLDGDKIFESLDEKEKENFLRFVDGEVSDNLLVNKIIRNLFLIKDEPETGFYLPVRYFRSANPVLLPNEMRFLKTAHRPNTLITINTATTEINYN